jgi:hypothetical protein
MLQAEWFGVQMLVEEREFSLLQNVQTSPASHIAPTKQTLGFFPRGKVARA